MIIRSLQYEIYPSFYCLLGPEWPGRWSCSFTSAWKLNSIPCLPIPSTSTFSNNDGKYAQTRSRSPRRKSLVAPLFRLEAQQNWNGCIQILIASDWVAFLPSADTKQIQPQLSHTHFRKFHNFKYSRKYQVCNNGNILDKYSIIENTLNFSWTHTNQLRSAVSWKF